MPDDKRDATRENAACKTAWRKDGMYAGTYSGDDALSSYETTYVGPLCAIDGRVVRAMLEVTYYVVQVPDENGEVDEDNPYGYGVNEVDHLYYQPADRVTGEPDYNADPLEWGEEYTYPDGPDVSVFDSLERADGIARCAAATDESWKMGDAGDVPEGGEVEAL